MNFEYSPYALPLIAAAFISVTIAIYAWNHRSAKGAHALFMMAVAIFIWTFAYSLEVIGTDLQTKHFWAVIEYFGVAFVPYSWFVLSLSYGNLKKFLTREFLILAALIPVLTPVVAVTNEWHNLLWTEYHIKWNGNFFELGTTHGWWFWVQTGYSYLLVLLGTMLLLRELRHRQGMYREQMIAMLIAALTPMTASMLYLTGNSPIPNLDLTPFAFTVTIIALAWAIFGFRLMDITPLARDRVLDAMSDGVIILNPRDHIVDINPAAAQMIGVLIPYAIGKSADEIFQPWTHLIERFRANSTIQDEISVGAGESKRSYEVRASLLKDQTGSVTGRVIMLRLTGGNEVPLPREPLSRPLGEEIRAEISSSAGRFWLVEFFAPKIKTDIPLDARHSPAWGQTLERIFTAVLRIIALLGLIAGGLILPGMKLSFVYLLPTISVIALFWTLALWRSLKLNWRTTVFILSLYALAATEMYNYGYSIEAFMYFTAIVVFGALFEELRGGLVALFVSLAIMATFGVLISQKIYYPVGVLVGERVTPEDLGRMFSSLIAYIAVAASLIAFITALLRSLNRAWQTEMQTLNLLQQERDLLDQRVQERTRDLAEARDQAIIVSKQMRKYYRAIEQSGSAVFIMDKDGKIEYVNPKFIEMSGLSLAESLGKIPEDLFHYENIKVDLDQEEWWKDVAQGEVWHGEFHNIRKDGSSFWVSATIAPVYDNDGSISNFVEIGQDITEQKFLQESLLLARDQALEASRLKSHLLARVSHELRTPLGGVLGYAELIQGDVYGEITTEQKEVLGKIIESTNYLTGIVNDLLDAAQIETRSLSLDPGFFSPEVLLKQVKDRMIVLAQNKGLAFQAELIRPFPDKLYGDEKRIQQILINLASNAIKFTKSGSVNVRLYQPAPLQWCMEVADTGVGIPKEAQQDIFVPFHQVNGKITHDNRGNGLGLSIVKQIVDIMGGMIELKSKVNQGSVFAVTLPITQPQEAV